MRTWVSVAAATLAMAVASPAHSATNNPVDSQVTDAITQTNVKVIGESPAMAMGTIYQTIARSTGLVMNSAPQLTQHALTLSQQQIQALDAEAGGTPVARSAGVNSTLARAHRAIDAIADRLDECGRDCLLNVHVHVEKITPLGARSNGSPTRSCDVGAFDITPSAIAAASPVSDAQFLTTCVVARMVMDLGYPVEGIATVIPDGDTGDSYSNDIGGVRWQDSPVTSIDLFVQRVP
jgi:hypothetical protein